MSIQDHYQAYASAFEESFVDDDWSRLEPYFTEDAVYEGDPDARGREAVLAKLKAGVDGFDHKMDKRSPSFQSPTVEGNTLKLNWTITYQKSGDLLIRTLDSTAYPAARGVAGATFTIDNRTVTAEISVNTSGGTTQSLTVKAVMQAETP